MIGRLRLRAGIYISAAMMLAGISLVAQAAQAVTRSEMESFVLATIGVAGVVVFSAFWVLLNTINGRSERALLGSVTRLELAVEKLLIAMDAHNNNPMAHTAASEHNHGPMNKKMDAIEEKLDQLLMEHRVIRGSEDEVCALVRSMAKRNPSESPKPKRKTDSKDDYTALRGQEEP